MEAYSKYALGIVSRNLLELRWAIQMDQVNAVRKVE
jgi:hypothetical protein